MEITKSELEEILVEHKHWIDQDMDGWENMRANLSSLDLSYADLRYVDLEGANLEASDLHGADLSGADLRGANLRNANLSCSILQNADLEVADLHCADLSGANLQNADLRDTYLKYTNLKSANLAYADLSFSSSDYVNLCFANLQGAILYGTDLQGANLTNADLSNAFGDLLEYRNGKVLSEPLTGYKKCKGGVIVTLEIPEGAIVFSINGDKCRTNKVKVLAIDGADVGISFHDGSLYHVGDEITISNFDCRYNVECSTGIHFFIDRKNAETYM